MFKSILRNLHRYILWALLSAILWSWIFTLLFSAPANKKVVLYADLPYVERNELSIALEQDLPEGIRVVDTAAFDDMMFNQTEVLSGDLYLIPESHVEKYLASFATIDRAAFPNAEFYEADGAAYGVLVHDGAGRSVGSAYVFYIPDERCWLFFNKDSKHIGAWNGSDDDAAVAIARQFLTLE